MLLTAAEIVDTLHWMEGLAELVGQVLDDKYRIESLLGRGGMGAVFRAVHLGTDRVVALKVITPTLATEPEYVERFRREARACGRLRHPSIVDVTDFDVINHNGRQLAYLVMEFLDGMTLADVLRHETRPPLPWVIDLLEQVCAGVEEAHKQGILHRDLKPENIWLEPNRRGSYSVKILDFGLARLDSGRSDDRVAGFGSPAARVVPAAPVVDDTATLMRTMDLQTIDSGVDSSGLPRRSSIDSGAQAGTSTIAGTPAYMSPEQTRGELVTPRSDVYSLGVIAYRLLAGSLPFEGTVPEVLAAQVEKEPPPLGQVRPDIHPDAERLVASALAKDPAQRPASAGAFGNILAAQLEPPVVFMRRALLLLIDRAGMFLSLAALASAPMLILSTVLALWPLGHVLVDLPAPGGRSATAMLIVLFVSAFWAQVALGALPIFVLHAIAAPLRPLDYRALLKAYDQRLRRWLRAMAPLVLFMMAWLVLVFASVVVVEWIGPWVRRSFPRPVRIAILLPIAVSPFLVAFYVLRRKRLNIRQMGFLGGVMLVEGLSFEPAAQRSAELLAKAGAMRNRLQKWYLGVVMILSGALGAFLGASGVIAHPSRIMPFAPIIAVVMMIGLLLNALLGALLYLSARRASGESMERVFQDFERAALPAEQPDVTHQDRLREQISAHRL
jgi:serine/threonine protein kinase